MESLLRVKAVPGASRNEIKGWLGDVLKVRVQAPPEDGKANKQIIALLAMKLDIPTASIMLISGATSPAKVFCLTGMDTKTMKNRIF